MDRFETVLIDHLNLYLEYQNKHVCLIQVIPERQRAEIDTYTLTKPYYCHRKKITKNDKQEKKKSAVLGRI